MATRDQYDQQVALLVRLLPLVAEQEVFALKGGTAINLFVRDLPRLSVDIDLTYLPVQGWDESIVGIDAALAGLVARVKAVVAGSQVHVQRSSQGHIERLHVQAGATIKIEVTPVLRGVVYDPEFLPVREAVEERYGFAEARVVSRPDLYGGKLVAAFDRQHPRDLFDVQLLLEHDGVSPELRRAFVAYVLESAKPLNVVLNPPRRDLALKFAQEFEGMTEQPVSLESLLETREEMIRVMVGEMPDEHRRFLLSFKRGEPDWSLLGLPHVAELPAVKFRIQKLQGLPPEARAEQLAKLEAVLQESQP